uniref:cytochrome b n=1 Tax=Euurobracon yokahamae TaxID=2911681 RepID=UPI00207AACD9|nr:cytochrome b [Euurobracon yokahamae]UJJ81894.1 cytochrome b [Euurobracon yokahamae]
MNKIIKNNKILYILSNSLIYLPTPVNINLWWNYGSMLGLCLITQLFSGLLLSMRYISNINYSFDSLIYIIQDVNYGWLMRLIHLNGASFFFICVYLHIGRGIYYMSFKLIKVWIIGIIILLTLMAIAFLGYVLPWGQMSFWGATVITNLISTLPYIGTMMIEWIWGGFSVGNATLNRFYTFHFLLSFILMFMIIMHLIFLHEFGSNNPLGISSNYYKIIFHNYFTLKDLMSFILLILLFLFMIFEKSYMLGDPENFIPANSLITPIHIQPEWYFLFAYTILRSIPNKLSGVIALILSILILFIKPMLYKGKFQGMSFNLINQIYFWFYVNSLILLTWLGSCLIEYPYMELSQILTVFYFIYYFLNYYMSKLWMI